MKKTFKNLIVIIIAIVIVSCGQKETKNNDEALAQIRKDQKVDDSLLKIGKLRGGITITTNEDYYYDPSETQPQIGYPTSTSNSTGSSNVYIETKPKFSTYNIVVGRHSLWSLTTGRCNLIIGDNKHMNDNPSYCWDVDYNSPAFYKIKWLKKYKPFIKTYDKLIRQHDTHEQREAFLKILTDEFSKYNK